MVVLLQPGALPKTSSGKLQRAACRQGWRERTLDAYAIYEYGRYVLGGADKPVQALTDEAEIALAVYLGDSAESRRAGAGGSFFCQRR